MKEEKINIPWDLMLVRLKGEADKSAMKQLDTWIAADKKHQDLWDELQLAWIGVRKANTAFNPDKSKAWPKIVRKAKVQYQPQNKSRYIYVQLAAACALLILGMWIGVRLNKPIVPEAGYITYNTQSDKAFISLPDSTQVWLNARSTLLVPAFFDSNKRQVVLRGEAFFDVAHNPEIPFIVNVDALTVNVYGTRFGIRAFDGEPEIEVSLFEGSVSLITEYLPEIHLDPEHTAFINRKNGMINISPLHTLTSIWANNVLYLEDKSFQTVAEALEKWYCVAIDISPDLKSTQYYTLTIRNESLAEILELMQKVGKFRYKIIGDTVSVW